MTAGMVSCMLLCWVVVFASLVILASSPYSSELLFPGGGWSASVKPSVPCRKFAACKKNP